MSYHVLTFAELSARFSSLRQAPLGDRRAPHKPLLILLMLGRYQRGNFRPLLFEEAQVHLKELLFEFGPPSHSINVLDPFWRLQNDGIWKVEDALGARVAETVAPPTASALVGCTARGNFVPDIAATLQKQATYIPRLARELLIAHFPQTLHPDICAAVGLELDNGPHEVATEQRLVREADFRPRIIRGYWLPKIRRNKQRDRQNVRKLRAGGWRVLEIWECETSIVRKLRQLRVRISKL